MNFSVVLIARNEAKTLPRLLASLSEFAQRGGEVVLVDTGSKDETVLVAKGLGAIVHEVGDRFTHCVDAETADEVNEHFVAEPEASVLCEGDRIFDFAAARNFAASCASSDMIAMPDCDEVYTQLDLDIVQSAIDGGAEQLEYDFVFAHDSEGKPITAFKHSKFYDRRKLRWVGVVHEVLKGEARNVSLPPSVLKLEHFQNHETNRSGYLRGLALDCFLNRGNDRNSHYFARELYYTKRYNSAIAEFDRHISMHAWAAERGQSAVFKGQCYEALGQPYSAWLSYNQALDIDASRREPWLRLAWFYFAKKDAQRVASYTQAALAVKNSGYYADNRADYAHVPHCLLYWAYWQLGEHDKSREHYAIAASLAPNDPNIVRDRVCYARP